MFERFTPAARRVVVNSQEVAIHLGSRKLRSTHVLAALLMVDDGPAAQALVGAGLDQRRFDQLINPRGRIVQRGPGLRRPKMDREVKAVLADALRHALFLDHDFISDRHILLGVLGRGGSAVRLLRAAGAVESDVEIRLAGIPVTEVEGQRAL